MKPVIKWIEYYLPKNKLTNEEISSIFPQWNPGKIKDKTGIAVRRIASLGECASDLAYEAANQLFDRQVCQRQDIDFILFCTQTPDYFLPTSACILQDRLGLSKDCGALDFNLGCSGYVYGLSLAKGLVESGQARNILLLTGDTYTKYLAPEDVSTRTIFGDAGTATLITISGCDESNKDYIGRSILGSDGSGAKNLIVKTGGMRFPRCAGEAQSLYMNGPEIFQFTLKNVPALVDKVLTAEGLALGDIDLFVFHQANKYILDHLREKIMIPEDKFYYALEQFGNTVSSSIPIALRCAFDEGKLNSLSNVLLIGFGVGYSWGGVLVRPFGN